jgi:predicted unusual protein kinase regulating ubiquinone biosynthesis (AarF/ABC1/UbiB family)
LRRTLGLLLLLAGSGLRLYLLEHLPYGSEAARQRRLRALWRAEGRRMRRAALRRGGLLIKLGQFLSTRADVLPQEFLEELGSLQDVVPPAPWPAVRQVLTASYGDELPFRRLAEEAHASASLAQVHFGELPDGTPCAVKILRPGIAEAVKADLDATYVAARFLQRHTAFGRRFDVLAIWREFADVTLAELDLPGEAERAERFRRLFRHDPWVRAPKVHREWTRPMVLVMSRVGGLKLDDVDGLRRAGLEPAAVARRLVDSYMQQWLVHGFFHADPHPGNVFVEPDGGLVYVDFGMMAEVRPRDRAALQKLVLAVGARDAEMMAEAVAELGFLRPGADPRRLKAALAHLVAELFRHGAAPDAVRGQEAEAFVREIQEFLFQGPFQLPARYTFLGRALGILAGLVARLAPEENFVELLVHAAERHAEVDAGAVGRAVAQLRRSVLRPLRQALHLLEGLDDGTVRLPVDLDPVREEIRRAERLQRKVVYAVLSGFAALLAAGANTLTPWEHHAAAALAAVFLLLALGR